MTVIRSLIALLVAGGIGYGLYTAVETQRAADAVVAEQAPIEDTAAADDAEADTGADAETASGADADGDAEASGAQVAMQAPIEDTEDAPATGDAAAPEDAERAEDTEGDASFAERTAQALASSSGGDTAGDEAPAPAQEDDTAAADAETPSAGEGTEAAAAREDAASDTEASADAASGETGGETETAAAAPAGDTAAALPAARIAEATSDSVDALKIVTGGMTYARARATMIDAGWTPRATEIAKRRNADSVAVTGLLALDYVELEGCSEAERAICRFEFFDGEGRIAAVLTAGSGEDPSVIDAFLMDIKQGE